VQELLNKMASERKSMKEIFMDRTLGNIGKDTSMLQLTEHTLSVA
jgi:hypothetical protein